MDVNPITSNIAQSLESVDITFVLLPDIRDMQ